VEFKGGLPVFANMGGDEGGVAGGAKAKKFDSSFKKAVGGSLKLKGVEFKGCDVPSLLYTLFPFFCTLLPAPSFLLPCVLPAAGVLAYPPDALWSRHRPLPQLET